MGRSSGQAAKHPRRSDVFRAVVEPPVESLLSADPHLRMQNDTESVHTARIATRKLRSDLRLFRPMLDATWVADVRARLKQLAALLGAVRDADVLAARMRTLAKRLPPEHAAAVDPILGNLRSVREAAYEKLGVELSAMWYASLLETLADAARDTDGHRLVVPNTYLRRRTVVARLMHLTWKKLKKAVRRARRGTLAADLHRIRIRAKSARYAAEAAAPFVPRYRRERLKRFMHHVTRLQDRLGRLHDAVLGQETLRTIAGADRLVIEEIVQIETAAAADMQTAWRASWERLSGRRSRFW
jgi:CHAD domain-containing protein